MSILESVGHRVGPRFDVAEVVARWSDIEAAVNVGHEVTLLLGGESWATITPT